MPLGKFFHLSLHVCMNVCMYNIIYRKNLSSLITYLLLLTALPVVVMEDGDWWWCWGNNIWADDVRETSGEWGDSTDPLVECTFSDVGPDKLSVVFIPAICHIMHVCCELIILLPMEVITGSVRPPQTTWCV